MGNQQYPPKCDGSCFGACTLAIVKRSSKELAKGNRSFSSAPNPCRNTTRSVFGRGASCDQRTCILFRVLTRSEERRVGKEGRSRVPGEDIDVIAPHKSDRS